MTSFIGSRSYEYCDLGEDSDNECAESSEDEINIVLHGSAQQIRRLRHAQQREQRARSKSPKRSQHVEQLSSSEDEFEREMNVELDKTFQTLNASLVKCHGEASLYPSVVNSEIVLSDNRCLNNDLNLDSDDDEDNVDGAPTEMQHQQSKLTNDDLMYDPDMDDTDQTWVDRQRHNRHFYGGCQNGGKVTTGDQERSKKSDAILNCPACMTTLCLDCQRHSTYSNQYRAMFVMNCQVKTSERLTVPEKKAKRKLKKGRTISPEVPAADMLDSTDQFFPVVCDVCTTIVGAIDSEEVYHFFNVLPSQP